MSEKKIDLIAQLLAKAEQTTPEEAEALMQGANALMAKYGIDQAMIDARRALHGQTTEKIVEKRIVFEGTYSRPLLHLGEYVVEALGSMRALRATRDRSRAVLFIIGYESDVEQADILVRSLHMQAMVALRSWWRQHRGEYDGWWIKDADRQRARRDFVRGFGRGAASRIRDARLRIIEEARVQEDKDRRAAGASAPAEGLSTELVLLDRQEKVNQHVDAMKVGTARPEKSKRDGYALGHGRRQGQQANTGERAVDQGRALTS